MESINFGYSTKNIPIANKGEYTKRLIEMTEKLTKRMRWKAFFFLNPDKRGENIDTYGFKSRKPPPHIKELEQFEKSMTSLIQNVKFTKISNKFQNKLQKDLRSINDRNNILVKADKTTNYYALETNTYKTLVQKNVTKTYKQVPPNTMDMLIKTDKEIAENLKLGNRIEKTAQKEAFITLKDHKPNFRNNPTCRLINPSKSEIGIISKQILEQINREITSATKTNQWRNTQSVIDWFSKLEDKNKSSFILFDVCNFYPSISEELLKKALQFARKHTKISDEQIRIIMHAKNTLLINDNNVWAKKETDSLFDVTMGSYDGAETCELVGTYLLSLMPNTIKNKMGLYRDDGLAICKDTPRNIEKIKKQICAVFKENNLKITIEANKKIVDFLDVTFNLNTGAYSPYTKPGNTILYVHKNSNHPPSILKNLPTNINRRLCDISSDKKQFDAATQQYQKALKESGYDQKLKYETNYKRKPRRNRSKEITWYNPPWNANVQTNIGKAFLKIVDNCFPIENKLNKIFNRHTLKISYSCMPNMKNKIDSHNKKLINESRDKPDKQKTCNCRNKVTCPMNGKCLEQSIIYQAKVTRNDNQTEEKYIGLCETTFKTRYNNHKSSFNNISKRNQTELSKHIWHLKEKEIDHNIKWNIVKRASSYTNTSKRCNLCLLEKYLIICNPKECTLNKRNELVSTCRHANKYLLNPG